MSGKVVSATAADALFGAGAVPADAEVNQVKPVETSGGANPADLRLIIEEAGTPGNYVYTVVDQRTGQIVSQLPRDELLRLKEHDN